MRITKQLALNIATALTAEKKKNVVKKELELRRTAREFAEKQIPTEILEMFKKYKGKNLFVITSNEQFKDVELNFKRFRFDVSIPDFFREYVEISKEDAKILQKLSLEVEKLEKETDELFREIQNALIGLKTFKNVRELFPEAAKYLPADSTSTALVVNLDSIRKKI